MESVFSFIYDGINFNKPLQLAIWNHENDSEWRKEEEKCMTYLKFTIPNYSSMTGTIFLASIQPSSTSIQTTLHTDLYISIPVITVITVYVATPKERTYM
jgi:hypothetical protein